MEVVIRNSEGVLLNVDVRDVGDGTYKVTYKVISKEKHHMAVYVRDKLTREGKPSNHQPIFDCY